MKGWMYILECSDGSYYTGSTIDIDKRLAEHQNGEGANHTKKRLPVKLIYFEEYSRIDLAFKREKQVQGWSRKKKEALIEGNSDLLPKLAIAYRDRERNVPSRASRASRASRTSATEATSASRTSATEATEATSGTGASRTSATEGSSGTSATSGIGSE